MNATAAIILAAGKGTRINSTAINKVMLPLNGAPMLSYTIDNMKQAGLSSIVIVVGYEKQSIVDYFKDTVRYAEQNEQLGTAHAFTRGLDALSSDIQTIISVYGDDSYIYPPVLYQKALDKHRRENADVTVLTVLVDDPTGLGRIDRDADNSIKAIIEEKDATSKQKNIHEINTGFYIFKREFVEEYLPLIQNENNAQEYYLTDIIDLAVKNNKNISDIREPNLAWRGVNNTKELNQAKEIMQNH